MADMDSRYKFLLVVFLSSFVLFLIALLGAFRRNEPTAAAAHA